MADVQAYEGSATCDPLTHESYLNPAKVARTMDKTEPTRHVPARA